MPKKDGRLKKPSIEKVTLAALINTVVLNRNHRLESDLGSAGDVKKGTVLGNIDISGAYHWMPLKLAPRE